MCIQNHLYDDKFLSEIITINIIQGFNCVNNIQLAIYYRFYITTATLKISKT